MPLYFHLNRFIRLEYEPVFGLDNIVRRFNEASHDTSNHFVEGLQYSLDEAVIMTGAMVPDHEVDHRNVNIQKFSRTRKIKIEIVLLFSNRLTMLTNGISRGFSNMLKTS